MAVDRQAPGKADSRRTSNPYTTERREKSLHERISSPKARPSIVFPGHARKASPNHKAALKDNPLYAYLNGEKPAAKVPSTTPKGPNTKTEGRATSRNDTKTQVRLPRNPEPEVQIRGSGAQMNMFSIRGASSTSISIKNLAPGTTQADVCTILNEQVGEVEDCKTFHVQGGLSTTAEVRFGSRIAADKAINILNGVLADNKRLDVSILLIPDAPQPEPTPKHSTLQTTRAPTRDHEMHDLTDQSSVPSQSRPTAPRKTQANPRNQQSQDLFANRKPKPKENDQNTVTRPSQAGRMARPSR